jgi:hypothetical protein
LEQWRCYANIMKRLVLIGCLVLALGAGIVLMAKRGSTATQPSKPQDASLLLVRAPKAPTNRLARFCLSNGTSVRMACMPEAFEQMTAGAWARIPLTGGGSRAVRDWIGVPEILGPGEAQTFMVPPPATTGTWRLVFMCQEQTPVADPVINTAGQITDAKARSTGLQQFSGRRYYVTSPEVAP